MKKKMSLCLPIYIPFLGLFIPLMDLSFHLVIFIPPKELPFSIHCSASFWTNSQQFFSVSTSIVSIDCSSHINGSVHFVQPFSPLLCFNLDNLYYCFQVLSSIMSTLLISTLLI